MWATTHRYSVHNIELSISSDVSGALQAIDGLLGAYALTSAAVGDGSPAGTIDIVLRGEASARGRRLYPAEPAAFRYDVARGYQQGADLLITDGYSELHVLDGKAVAGVLRPPTLEDPHLFAGVTFNLALQACLREAGLFYTHAAAVESPWGTVLLAGDSQAGKTTLALALVAEGWGFISDDAVYLRDREPVEVLAFRRPLHLSKQTLSMFPAMKTVARGPIRRGQRLRWDVSPEQAFSAERVRGQGSGPVAIGLLRRSSPTSLSQIRPVDRATALQGLLRQSALVMLGGPSTQAHLETLARTARYGASFDLSRGGDAGGHPQQMARALVDVCTGLVAGARLGVEVE